MRDHRLSRRRQRIETYWGQLFVQGSFKLVEQLYDQGSHDQKVRVAMCDWTRIIVGCHDVRKCLVGEQRIGCLLFIITR